MYALVAVSPGTLGPGLSKTRSKLPALTAFGTVLRSLREQRRLSTGQVERLLSEKSPLGRSTLSQYENGAVWSPDPVVLSELATLYYRDVRSLIEVLKANRQNPDLTKEQADAVMEGAADANAVAPGLLAKLEVSYAHAMREVSEIAGHLVRVAEAHGGTLTDESRAADRRTAARRKGN